MADQEHEYKTFSIQGLISTEKRNMPRSWNYLLREFFNVFTDRQLKNATAAFSVYDENGVHIRTIVLGDEPDAEMQRIIDQELGPEPDEPVVRTA